VAGDFSVFALKEEQRFPFVNFRVFHFPDKNGVIPGDMSGNQLAAEAKKSLIQNGNAARRPMILNGQALLGLGALFALREVLGDGLLALLQHTDPEVLFLLEHRQYFRPLVHTNQNQHGIEGDRCKRVGGHPENMAWLALNGYDSYAGSELA